MSTRVKERAMLDVEIPTVKLERYSVMFGSVLAMEQPQSLLERRQGSSDKVRPLNHKALKVTLLVRSVKHRDCTHSLITGTRRSLHSWQAHPPSNFAE